MADSDGAPAGAGAAGAGMAGAEVMGERRFLIALAFRMLGTIAEAEDAVQETYTRWYRMDQAGRDAIGVPRAWLTRVASRICLDMLSCARVRRERYVGPWLPEPARNPVYGADRVARFLLGALRREPAIDVLEQETNDGLGFAMWDEGRIAGVVTLEVFNGLITDVRMMLNPDKLSLWN